MANHNQKNNQHTNKQKHGKTQIPQPDLRLTIRKTAKQTANGARAQQEKPQEICQGHSGENPLCHNKDKNMQQTNYATQKRETCELRGCQQGNKKSRLLYTVNQPSLSESTHKYLFTCPNSEKDPVPDGINTSRRTMTCMARCLVPLPIAGSGPVVMTARSHRAR